MSKTDLTPVQPPRIPDNAELTKGSAGIVRAISADITLPMRAPTPRDFTDYGNVRNAWLITDIHAPLNVRGGVYKAFPLEKIMASHTADPESRLIVIRSETDQFIGCCRVSLRTSEKFLETYECKMPGATKSEDRALEVILYVVCKEHTGLQAEINGVSKRISRHLLDAAL